MTVIVKDGQVSFEADGEPQGTPIALPEGVEVAMAVSTSDCWGANGVTFDLELETYTNNLGTTFDVLPPVESHRTT